MTTAAIALPDAAAVDFLQKLDTPAHILVAISGGSDSTGLLVALAKHIKVDLRRDILLSAATVDHALRAESAAEAIEVGALCAKLNIPHFICRWEGQKPATGIMAAARDARYRLLADAAAACGANVIATGHTFDDQRETLLMRAARSSGTAEGEGETAAGIAEAMLFDRRIWVLRPFLSCRRNDIRAFLDAGGYFWIDDPSNDDEHYERVRIRKSLIEGEAAFGVSDLRKQRELISHKAADWFRGYARISHGVCILPPEALKADDAVLGYAIGNLIAVLGGKPFVPSRTALSQLVAFLRSGQNGRRTLGGVVVDRRKKLVFLQREYRGLPLSRLGAFQSTVWDGRFVVTNSGTMPIDVIASRECASSFDAGDSGGDVPDLLPKSVRRLAFDTMPGMRILSAADGGSFDIPAGDLAVHFAPFDHYLSAHDLPFAQCLAESFGKSSYLKPPV